MTGWRSRARRLVCLLCVIAAVSCRHERVATAPSARAAKPSASVRSLQSRIDGLLNAPSLASGTWGVLVRSLRQDDDLYSLNARKLLTPASNLKVVTLAAAAEALGWDYTWETRILGLGAIDYGFLDGDLIVSGSGDPSLAEDDGSAQAAFASWATRLKTAGVLSLSGRIIGDDNAFDDEGLGAGWMWDDLDRGYSAGIGALQLNRGSVRLLVRPGATEGSPGALSLSSDGAGLTIRNHVVTAPVGTPPSIRTHRAAGSHDVDVSGAVPTGAAPIERTLAVDNPTLFFVSELRKALVAAGIEVRGPAVDIDALDEPPRLQDAVPLVTHRSPTLAVLADMLMKLSQNQYAETLVKTMGARAGVPTFEGGLQAIGSQLASWGIPKEDAILADGSGLSRYNLITPSAMVGVLTHVSRDPRLREPFEAALPVAARAGTLGERLKDTPAAGTLRAKTGSMTNVRSMAGYMQTADGEPIVFSIVANNYGIPGAEIDRTIDAILLQIATFHR